VAWFPKDGHWQFWKPDGTPLDPAVIPSIEHVTGFTRGYAGDPVKGPNLVFVISQPDIDEASEMRPEINSTDGSAVGIASYSTANTPATPSVHDTGWMMAQCLLSDLRAGTSKVHLKMRFGPGPWISSPVYAPGKMAGEGFLGIVFGGSGAGSRDDVSFATVLMDQAFDLQMQWRVVTVAKTGERILRRFQQPTGVGGQWLYKLEFDLPFERVEGFVIETRPMKAVEFKDVILPPRPDAK
jgi:hypothetical protein